MIGALFFLVKNSWVNSMKLRIRRLKQPKYLIGAIFGLLYIVYLFGIRIVAGFASSRHRGGPGVVTPENAQMFEAVGALIYSVPWLIFFLAWIFGRERASLIFSEAEVAFLFPAPVSRRALIHYKLIKSQVAILFMILFLTLIFGRFWSGGMAWMRSLGWWVILTTLNLHIIAASFAREKLFERGISSWKWRTAVLTLVGAAGVGVYFWARQTIPPPDVARTVGNRKSQATAFQPSSIIFEQWRRRARCPICCIRSASQCAPISKPGWERLVHSCWRWGRQFC